MTAMDGMHGPDLPTFLIVMTESSNPTASVRNLGQKKIRKKCDACEALCGDLGEKLIYHY